MLIMMIMLTLMMTMMMIDSDIDDNGGDKLRIGKQCSFVNISCRDSASSSCPPPPPPPSCLPTARLRQCDTVLRANGKGKKSNFAPRQKYIWKRRRNPCWYGAGTLATAVKADFGSASTGGSFPSQLQPKSTATPMYSTNSKIPFLCSFFIHEGFGTKLKAFQIFHVLGQGSVI